MGIILQKRGDGYEPHWRGRWEVDGKRKTVSLNRWRGTPPGPGEEKGDAEFEKSKARAEELFKRIRNGEKSAEEEASLVRQIHAARYGGKVERVKLAELAERWETLPRRGNEKTAARVRLILGRFVRYMAENFPKVTEAGGLTAEHFKGFLAEVDGSGVSARTWNDIMGTLRGVLAKVDGQSRGFREYLAKLPKRTENTIHRKPFSGDELEAIFTAAAEIDPELRPVLVAAACTALRRGDVCLLRWSDVDLAEGFVTVKTSKTGETVDIPIFPPFRVVLEAAAAKRKTGVPYVFARVAATYKRNPCGLDARLRRVLAAAGFVRPGRTEGDAPPLPPAEQSARATLADAQTGGKRQRRGSLCGWHSFRTTFCTVALANGVPMELLRKITGHRTAEIVLKHYDRRGREAMRRAFGAAMPKAIAGTVETVPADVARVSKMLAGASKADLAKIEKILAKKGGKK